MTKKSNKSHSIIFTRNTYTEDEKLISQNITGENVVLLKVSFQIVMINFEQL